MKNTNRRRLEGANHEAPAIDVLATDQLLPARADSLPQFPGCLFRERHRDDWRTLVPVRPDFVEEPCGEDSRLAAPRTRSQRHTLVLDLQGPLLLGG